MKEKKKIEMRVETGVQGFDILIEGGFPKASEILVSGRSGTGKTIFSLEFLYNGAEKFGEKGLYITFEEKKEALLAQAKQFNWDFEKLEKKNKVKIVSYGTKDIDAKSIQDILEMANSFGAQRLVIDSLSNLVHLMPPLQKEYNPIGNEKARFLHSFVDGLKELQNCTKLLIAQERNEEISSAAEYLCDGVLSFKFESLGTRYDRSLTISKMRRTKTKVDYYPVEITEKGVVVHRISDSYTSSQEYE